MWSVYILRSLKDDRHYIGSTGDVVKGLHRHNQGGNVSTKNRKPFILVHVESFHSKREAPASERQIKHYKGGEAFKKLIEA